MCVCARVCACVRVVRVVAQAHVHVRVCTSCRKRMPRAMSLRKRRAVLARSGNVRFCSTSRRLHEQHSIQQHQGQIQRYQRRYLTTAHILIKLNDRAHTNKNIVLSVRAHTCVCVLCQCSRVRACVSPSKFHQLHHQPHSPARSIHAARVCACARARIRACLRPCARASEHAYVRQCMRR